MRKRRREGTVSGGRDAGPPEERQAGPPEGQDAGVGREAPLPRSRLRVVAPTGAMLTVLVPMAIHLLATPPASQFERRYYISAQGDDARDGSSPARAWRTLARARHITFRPGDQVLLEGGARFTGAIRLGPAAAGDPANPVVIGSYGSGRATIDTAGESGITVYNTAGVEIRNLTLVGDSSAYRDMAGIKLYNDLPGGRKLEHVVISGFDVSGFRNGVEVGGGSGASGFRDVTVSDGAAHGNRDAGLVTFGPPFDPASPKYAHESVTVSGVSAFDNPGNPNEHRINTGSGIALGSVHDALVERSTAHDNGARCSAPTGPVGIWAYDSANVIVQHNLAFRNRTGGHTDGGGFDLDQNVSSSVLQYNLAYGNAGAGFMLFSDRPNDAMSHDVVRFNISDNDVRDLPYYGALYVAGRVRDAQIYHNTVVVSASGPRRPPALVLNGLLKGVVFRNNVLRSSGTRSLWAFAEYRSDQVLLQGNDLFATAQPDPVSWGARTFSSLADWREATGQERVNGIDAGLSVDPGFVRDQPSQVAGADRARDFIPAAGSALVGAGLGLRALGTDPGPVDYFGRPLTDPATIGAVQPPTAGQPRRGG